MYVAIEYEGCVWMSVTHYILHSITNIENIKSAKSNLEFLVLASSFRGDTSVSKKLVMDIQKAKFDQHPVLKERLINTYPDNLPCSVMYSDVLTKLRRKYICEMNSIKSSIQDCDTLLPSLSAFEKDIILKIVQTVKSSSYFNVVDVINKVSGPKIARYLSKQKNTPAKYNNNLILSRYVWSISSRVVGDDGAKILFWYIIALRGLEIVPSTHKKVMSLSIKHKNIQPPPPVHRLAIVPNNSDDTISVNGTHIHKFLSQLLKMGGKATTDMNSVIFPKEKAGIIEEFIKSKEPDEIFKSLIEDYVEMYQDIETVGGDASVFGYIGDPDQKVFGMIKKLDNEIPDPVVSVLSERYFKANCDVTIDELHSVLNILKQKIHEKYTNVIFCTASRKKKALELINGVNDTDTESHLLYPLLTSKDKKRVRFIIGK